jgi:hypothetical protein
MKRFLMLVAVAAVAGVMYVAAAPGSRQASLPTARQFAALKKQVTKLKRSVTALKKDETKVKSAAADADAFIATCFLTAGVAPVSQFGDPSGTYGFEYNATPPTTPPAPTSRTALDLDSSATPQGYLQSVDPTCIGSGSTTSARVFSSSRHLPVLPERAH